MPRPWASFRGLERWISNGSSSPASGPLALPTHLTWTYDFNTSAGAYAAPVGFVQGTGTMDLEWKIKPCLGPARSSDPSDMDIRLQYERRCLCRARGLRSGDWNDGSQMEDQALPRARSLFRPI